MRGPNPRRFYTPPPACPTSPWASGKPVTPANLFGSGTCCTKDKQQQRAGADIDAGEAAFDLDSCDPAAPPVQPTTAAPSVQPTIAGADIGVGKAAVDSDRCDPAAPSVQHTKRTSSESGDVATGTHVVPPSSAPTSNKTPPPASPPAHGGNKPGTCLLPGMCFTFWKEGFYEARQRVTDTEDRPVRSGRRRKASSQNGL